MPPRRVTDDEDLREAISTEVRRALREQYPNGVNAAIRSADTLRRDIGILAILLGMAAQTGMGFYWAGGVSRSQDSLREEVKQVSGEQAYIRAQLQVLDGQFKEMKGKQDERDRYVNGKGR